MLILVTIGENTTIYVRKAGGDCMEEKIECVKCGWVGGYGDLIAPTSAHEPSCPECLSDDFVDCQHDIRPLSDGYDDNPYWKCLKCKEIGLFEEFQP